MNINKKILSLLLLVVFCTLLPLCVQANEQLVVNVNQSRLIPAYGAIQVAIANPAIADVVVASSNELLVIGKSQGSTMLHVWYSSGGMDTYSIVVGGDDQGVSNVIKRAIGYDNLTVTLAGKKIILEGMVQNQAEKKRAEQIAKLYATDVSNLLEMASPKQIKIEVKILEIATDKADKIGVELANATIGENGVEIGQAGIFGMGQSFRNGIDGQNFGWFGSYADINARVNLLIKNGDAKVLSQPNIITLSGEKASILIGGEIPVPVNVENNTVTVEWREYGIKLNIEPTVDSKNNILSKVAAEVSSIDYASALSVSTGGINVPALKSRKAETTLQLQSGNTMAVGGLIMSDESKSISKFPILGDIPIIGQFFRNTSKTKERKEIVILLTPILVSDEYIPTMSYEASALLKEKLIDTDSPEVRKQKKKALKEAEEARNKTEEDYYYERR
mgnify:CR=1 FL=1